MIRVKTVDNTSTVTTVTIATDIGEFQGQAFFNAEADGLNPSAITGGKIAENRARIKYLKEKIKRKKYELKGVERLLAAMPPGKQGYVYAIHLKDAIENEIKEYLKEWESCDHTIKTTIEGRAMYIRSRTIDKKDRDKFFKELGNALQQLDKTTKDKNIK